MTPNELIAMSLICAGVAMIFAAIPMIRTSSDLGISVPRFFQDWVKWLFKGTNCFEKIWNGFLVVCIIPSFIAATLIWAGKCALVYIWELFKSRGGKYYD